ncbi:MAG: tetratricopeptide repeat protein, partial [Deltaproteobacteria bacterium]|nr:tetratricopeptide repeat protein [Deltaproteobacteria bacterium]
LDRVKAQYDLANLLYMQGHYQESKKMFEQVLSASLERDEWIKKARQKITQIRQKRGRSKEQIALRLIEAEERVEEGSDLYATKTVLLEILARTEGKQAEQADKAKDLLERLWDKERSLVTRELSNIQLLREEKKLAEARELLQKILVDYPDMEERGHVESLLQELEQEEEVARIAEAKKGHKRVSLPTTKSSETKFE